MTSSIPPDPSRVQLYKPSWQVNQQGSPQHEDNASSQLIERLDVHGKAVDQQKRPRLVHKPQDTSASTQTIEFRASLAIVLSGDFFDLSTGEQDRILECLLLFDQPTHTEEEKIQAQRCLAAVGAVADDASCRSDHTNAVGNALASSVPAVHSVPEDSDEEIIVIRSDSEEEIEPTQ